MDDSSSHEMCVDWEIESQAREIQPVPRFDQEGSSEPKVKKRNGEMMIDAEGKLRKKKFDPKANREILARMMIELDAPFNMVEWRLFREYQKFLKDDCAFVSRITSAKDILKVSGYESVQALLCARSRSWLHGFEELNDDNNGDQDNETRGSGQASNNVDFVNLNEE